MSIELEAAPPSSEAIEAFIAYWQGREGGQERANYQIFLIRFCRLLNLPEPDAADATHEHNNYVFERAVTRHRDDGDARGRIDLYRRGCFVLEAKQSRMKGGAKEISGQSNLFAIDEGVVRGRPNVGRAWDVLMLNAKRQAEDYARALPISHGWPPFVLICDVGNCIEVYADFSGQGKNYSQFPDRQNFRIYLEQLRNPEVCQRLQHIWLDPQSLNPAHIRAKVTRDIAERLAAISKVLEAKQFPASDVALFLMRCLFTMFAEDMTLLPSNSFRDLLEESRVDPTKFVPLLTDLWRSMNTGTFAPSIRSKVLLFNGNLFSDARVLPLKSEEIGELAVAASKDWREVEPAIFGTLLEQALDRKERQRLGAHYTPRPHVERLVVSTIMEPLREDWRNVLTAAEIKRAESDIPGAISEVTAFHEKLCDTRVLDPACGTGNFLYVALALMKELEGEVLDALSGLTVQSRFQGYELRTIDPHQFLGMEINPRAAAIAELVLWIGYLQWHYRIRGGTPPEPVLREFKNIEEKNAVLTWDGYPLPQAKNGKEVYPRARIADWPTAEFIIGNPPFIGAKYLRERLGNEYTNALWVAHSNINESADFVMYWWDRAAEQLSRPGSSLRRFGFVTTNSITQEFSGRVIKKRIEGTQPISLVMAIPDHPWTKATPDAAAVRIAMTVAERGECDGVLRILTREGGLDTDHPLIEFDERIGRINADLTIGTDVTSAVPLRANEGVCSPGVKLHGDGFIVTPNEAQFLGLGRREGLENFIKPYRHGRDISGIPRGMMVIDLFGLTAHEVRRRFPEVYQHVLEEVKEKKDSDGNTVGRDANNRGTYRTNWWLFGEPRSELRPALIDISRFIVTPVTAKNRFFQFLETSILPDDALMCFASDDAFVLGVLSSSIFAAWFAATGSTLEDRPRFIKSRCFDPYPFPLANNVAKSTIRAKADEIDSFRKKRQLENPGLTLTQMYTVLEKLNAGAPLSRPEENIREKGLIRILKELHNTLDQLVFDSYGWNYGQGEAEVLAQLVALNEQRAAEEARGAVGWLRPDYQISRFGKSVERGAVKAAELQLPLMTVVAGGGRAKPSFPDGAVAQTAAVFSVLANATRPLNAA